MAIPIIGRGGTTETKTDRLQLPTAELDLPLPDAVPEAHRVIDVEQVQRLLSHSSEIVRNLMVDRIGRLPEGKSLADKLIPLVGDATDRVAADTIRLLGSFEHSAAIDSIEKRFESASGEVAAEAATALGRLAPDRLLEAVKRRSRLDDHAYVQAMTALARCESPAALDYLGRSMNRAGAIAPERRAALYSVALLSGSAELCARVIGMALSDSRSEERPGEVSPARAALASLAGFAPAHAAQSVGGALLENLREPIGERLPGVPADRIEAMEQALRKKQLGTAIDALAPLLARSTPGGISEEQGSVLRRRRGVLKALIDQKDAIERLPPEAGALFVMVAIAQAELVSLASSAASDSPAVITLSKLLATSPAEVAALSQADLKARFESEGERRMRQVAGILSNEAVYGQATLEHFLNALVEAGGAAPLFDAAVGSKQEGFVSEAVRALVAHPSIAEPVIREVLERRPLETEPTRLALIAAARLGTERLSLVIARRFYDLRQAARFALVEAIVQIGDVRLRPLLESRGFPGEVEEAAGVMLAVLAGEPVEGVLKEKLERIQTTAAPTLLGETEEELRLPLRCKRCDETLTYGVKRVFLDPKSESEDGDAIFAGDFACKACGGVDTLATTPMAAQLMSESMLSMIQAQREGAPIVPRVIPRTTRIAGKELGVAAALREAEKMVVESPDSIRARLMRARIRLMLWRKSAREDAEKVLSIDPRSPEGLLLLGGALAQERQLDQARDRLADAYRLLEGSEEPRFYESDERGIRQEVEDALLELEEMEIQLPADLSLDAARERRTAEMERYAQRLAQAEQRMRGERGGPGRPAATESRPAFVKPR